MAAPCAMAAMALILMWLPLGCADGPLITTTTAGATTASTTLEATTSTTSTTSTTTTTSTTSTTTTSTTTTTIPERCQSPASFSCSSSAMGANTAELRIMDGTYEILDQYCGGRWGRLEIKQDGSWGQICDENFGDADARVSCRQMGFADGFQIHDFYYSGRLSPPASTLPVVMTGPQCTGSESRVQDCPSFGTAPSSSSLCSTPRYSAGVLCLGSQPSTAELKAMCPKLIFTANDQRNKETHPLSIKSYFPGGSYTSGFGGTGVSTADGGLGNYGGTYRGTVAEIQNAWNEISDSEVPNMGGHQWRYPMATKSRCYSSFAADLAEGPCTSTAASSSGSSGSAATTATTSVVGSSQVTVTSSSDTAGTAGGKSDASRSASRVLGFCIILAVGS